MTLFIEAIDNLELERDRKMLLLLRVSFNANEKDYGKFIDEHFT